MASIELAPLSAHLESDDVKAVLTGAREAGAKELDLDADGDTVVFERDLDADLFADFLDQLDANEAACDIYVPADFEEVFEIAGYRVGSANALVMVLEELKEDFFVDDDEDEAEETEEYEDYDEELAAEDEEISDTAHDETMELKDQQFRHFWKVMHKAGRTAMARGVCMFLRE
jgi:hypothetical protein